MSNRRPGCKKPIKQKKYKRYTQLEIYPASIGIKKREKNQNLKKK